MACSTPVIVISSDDDEPTWNKSLNVRKGKATRSRSIKSEAIALGLQERLRIRSNVSYCTPHKVLSRSKSEDALSLRQNGFPLLRRLNSEPSFTAVIRTYSAIEKLTKCPVMRNQGETNPKIERSGLILDEILQKASVKPKDVISNQNYLAPFITPPAEAQTSNETPFLASSQPTADLPGHIMKSQTSTQYNDTFVEQIKQPLLCHISPNQPVSVQSLSSSQHEQVSSEGEVTKPKERASELIEPYSAACSASNQSAPRGPHPCVSLKHPLCLPIPPSSRQYPLNTCSSYPLQLSVTAMRTFSETVTIDNKSINLASGTQTESSGPDLQEVLQTNILYKQLGRPLLSRETQPEGSTEQMELQIPTSLVQNNSLCLMSKSPRYPQQQMASSNRLPQTLTSIKHTTTEPDLESKKGLKLICGPPLRPRRPGYSFDSKLNPSAHPTQQPPPQNCLANSRCVKNNKFSTTTISSPASSQIVVQTQHNALPREHILPSAHPPHPSTPINRTAPERGSMSNKKGPITNVPCRPTEARPHGAAVKGLLGSPPFSPLLKATLKRSAIEPREESSKRTKTNTNNIHPCSTAITKTLAASNTPSTNQPNYTITTTTTPPTRRTPPTRPWTPVMLTSYIETLRASMDNAAFAEAHGKSVQDLRDTFEEVVAIPLHQYSSRGIQRIRDFNQRMRTYRALEKRGGRDLR